ncbi:Permease component of ABC-type sugar transporter [Agrobacterium fabacearum TT111]|nr:Permease component of ABC-type sugar transporter [Agrobacterium fabacearum TT111]CUX03989.1 Permease component of ABC-type sugar transporter [Agrobacterium fabacearum TT111]
MATRNTSGLARVMLAPSVLLLLVWMIVPLAMTLWFSFQNYNLLNPANVSFAGLFNYQYFYTDPAFFQSIFNTLAIVGGVLLITVIGGIAIALLLDQDIFGQGIVRIMIISPFFVMPPVAALVWKNMIMHPGYGVLADLSRFFGLQPVDWFAQFPLLSIIIIVAWQWLPFGHADPAHRPPVARWRAEGSGRDGWRQLHQPLHLPDAAASCPRHHRRHPHPDDLPARRLRGNPRHHQWRPRAYASTNLAFLIYRTALLGYDVGGASAGGIIAVVLANIVAIFLMRAVGKNLDR